MEHLFLNTLSFSFPSEPVTFYFSDEDKHLPDLLMWLYYILIGLISISPSYIALIHFMS